MACQMGALPTTAACIGTMSRVCSTKFLGIAWISPGLNLRPPGEIRSLFPRSLYFHYGVSSTASLQIPGFIWFSPDALAQSKAVVIRSLIFRAHQWSSKPRYRRNDVNAIWRSEEHKSELQSLMRISYAVFCLQKKNNDRLSSGDAQATIKIRRETVRTT